MNEMFVGGSFPVRRPFNDVIDAFAWKLRDVIILNLSLIKKSGYVGKVED